MQESSTRTRRHWADVVVILMGLLLVGLAAWVGPASEPNAARRVASLPSLWVAYAGGGVLALLAMFVVHRWIGVGRLLVVASALLLLGYGFAAFRGAPGQLWATILIPGVLLLGVAPFFGPMPRAQH